MFTPTNSFGQPSMARPFGSQSVFGQTSNSTTKPFGSPNSFGSSTGSSKFGGTSKGAFGQDSTPTFGLSSSPVFGCSAPAFGSSSPPAFAFGQPSMARPFGPQSVFGQTINSTTNPFGSPNPFGSSTGSSKFGGTSTVAFGQDSSPTFGLSSSPVFGGSAPAFGSSSPPAFGSSLSWQKPPSFGISGSAPSQTQPAFGGSGFGSTTTFGTSSQSAFGTNSSPNLGSINSTSFKATSSPAFAVTNTPTFGSEGLPTFGVQRAFPFGTSRTPAFGAKDASSFGTSSIPAFWDQSTFDFGSSSTPTLAAASISAFGLSTAPFAAPSVLSFNFGSMPSMSTSTFGTTQFGTMPSPFGSQSSTIVAQTATTTFCSAGFGQSNFGGRQQTGSGVAKYKKTTLSEGNRKVGEMHSLSAMPVHKDKSHEELRWEDYRGKKNSDAQPAARVIFPASSIAISGQPTVSATSPNPFAPTTSTLTFTGSSPASTSVLSSPSTSLFGLTSSPTFSFSPSTFGPSMVEPSSAFGPSLVLRNGQSCGLFHSSNRFQQPTSSSSSKNIGMPFAGLCGSLFNSSSQSTGPISTSAGSSQTTNAPPAFQSVSPAETSASSTGFDSTSSILGQRTFGQVSSAQPNMVVQAVRTGNPSVTVPTLPQMSTGQLCYARSVQYGISCLPVAEKEASARKPALSAPRHFSQRRIRLPVRKYNPKFDGPKVPFFMDDEVLSTSQKTKTQFIPRENPRLLVIPPVEVWPTRMSTVREPEKKNAHSSANEIGKASPTGNGVTREQSNSPPAPSNSIDQKPDWVFNEQSQKEADSPGHMAGEAAMPYEHGVGIESVMPKLHHADYYTEPQIQELAAKERAEPGYCRYVKDFVVGRHGYGSIKFDGKTDVRRLDLDSIIQFNNREVIVYMDENRKPPIGQGLNKPAEVRLLNINCIIKKTGKHLTDGPNVEKYKEMLKKKVEERGAEFVSYDAVEGLWKFKVSHF